MFVEHKEVGEVAEAPAKITKLSEAIRIGARLRPQCVGEYFMDGRSCAYGAAWEAMGRLPYEKMPAAVTQVCEELGFYVPLDVAVKVYSLNDSGWTRERIADWLEGAGY